MLRQMFHFLFIILCTLSLLLDDADAQRFSSGPPSSQMSPQGGDENALRAFEAYKAGNIDLARKYLGDSKQSDPYAMFVNAALDPDAVEAADMYKEIVAENHGRPVAGEALLKLYKYHYATGDYQSARTDYVELKKYPTAGEVADPSGLEDSLITPARASAPITPSVTTSAADNGPERASTKFIVQVGVFTTLENARNFIGDLRDNGIEGTVFTKDAGGRSLYGVSAGTFSSRDAAEDYARELKSRSVDCIVVEM